MRQLLGTTLLLAMALLTGCGDSDSGGTPDSTPGSPVACDDGAGDCAGQPVLVSGTGGGGEVTTEATELPDAAAVTAYVKQFDAAFATEVRSAADDIGLLDGNVLVAAVISVGCDVPPGVDVTRATDGGIVMEAQPVSAPKQECFAPVTTVALAGVPG